VDTKPEITQKTPHQEVAKSQEPDIFDLAPEINTIKEKTKSALLPPDRGSHQFSFIVANIRNSTAQKPSDDLFDLFGDSNDVPKQAPKEENTIGNMAY